MVINLDKRVVDGGEAGRQRGTIPPKIDVQRIILAYFLLYVRTCNGAKKSILPFRKNELLNLESVNNRTTE